jgi:hypothetical protein
MAKRSAIERAVEWLSQRSDEPPPQIARRSGSGRKRRRPAPERHNRKCSVWRHADRAAIDQDFLSWHSPDRIAEEYGIADHSSIYRHAHATGLFRRRAGTTRIAFGPGIDRLIGVKVTARSIIRALGEYSRMNDNRCRSKLISNRQTERLEHGLNY